VYTSVSPKPKYHWYKKPMLIM